MSYAFWQTTLECALVNERHRSTVDYALHYIVCDRGRMLILDFPFMHQ